ncbi:MAG: 4-hydroxy-tetrahydrodipicolinate synthase [Gammaproteobacteria bacterium]|nr:4-hydroxy-tetrahydrodipicolinate synthase [Gammaproteobacteria bacterium]
MFQGSIVALVTPMKEDGQLAEDALARLIDWHVAQGTDGLVIAGTTGESATLDEQEHCHLLRLAMEINAGRLPLIAGTGANSTREAIALTRCARDAGVDACLLVTPYYNKPTQEGLYRHFTAVAEAVDVPQILYNVPGRTACDMVPETVARLASVANIMGIKEATGDIGRVTRIRELCGPDFAIYSGEDGNALDAMVAGAQGVISVTANAAPGPMHEMCRLALAGEEAAAREIDARLRPLHDALFLESNPIPVKWAVAELGLMPAGIRLPLTPLSEQFHDSVRGALRHAGMID